MYDNLEQLSLEVVVIEHWDKFFFPPLQSIFPENSAFFVSDGAAFSARETTLS
jgi:hypothetical protein